MIALRLVALLLLGAAATSGGGQEACPDCWGEGVMANCTDVRGFPMRRLVRCLPPGVKELVLREAGAGPLGASSFAGLDALETLDLSDNAVALLHEEALRGLRRLRSFSCRNCSLEALGARFLAWTPQLERLDLSWNHLRKLPRGFMQPMRKLKELLLLGNHLTVLPPGWLRKTRGLTLRAEGNRWHCDCQAYYMMMALASAAVDHDMALDVCESPIHYRGAVLKALVKGTCR